MNKTYCNLHTHGVFSMLDGLGQYKDYVARAVQLGMPALAITEHGNLSGWLDFYEACKEAGIKPLLGIEAYQARKTRFDRDEEELAGPSSNEWSQRGPYHITLIAKNLVGYKNLIKLSSRSYLEGYYRKPRIDFELLEDHAEGIIVLSGCLGGGVCQALLRGDYEAALSFARRTQSIVGKDNYFIEVMDHEIPEERQVVPHLIKIAETIGAKIVPTGDCHYVNKEDHEIHDAMLCIQTAARIEDENRFSFAGPHFYLKSYDEMAKSFRAEWLQNTVDLAEMVNVELKFDEFHYPKFLDLPSGISASDYLHQLTYEGAAKKYETITPEIKERIDYELGVINRMGFAHYFLVVQDIVNWARNNNITVGAGRGSVVGCVVAYALGIVGLDPIKYNLMFERFLVDGRPAPPDADLDFADRDRDRVIEYMRHKYGADKVCQIITINNIGARSAIRDVARVLGYEYIIGDEIAKKVAPSVAGFTKSIEESLAESKEFSEAYHNDPIARKIIDLAKSIEGIPRHTGVHAGGIVITEGPLIDYVPLMQKGPNEPVIAQWPKDTIEKIGLLKIDCLGLKTLTVVADCLAKIDHAIPDPLSIPLEDKRIYEELAKGNTVSTFQLEGSGITSLTMSMVPERIEDLMAIQALYRPGPMGSNMHNEYVARKHGRKKIKYLHPKLEPILKDTMGLMVYQDSILTIAKELAGMTTIEADSLRKAVGKKDRKGISKYRDAFVEGCLRHSNISKEISNQIYTEIEKFGLYGFGMGHACSYSWLAYVTTYLRIYYPAHYMAALLTSVTDKKSKMAAYLYECRRMGLNVLAPDIVKSKENFEVLNETDILFGLGAIDGVGSAMVRAILRNRKEDYTGLLDYFRNCDPAILNKKTIEHLSAAGAFDSLLSDYYKVRMERSEKLDVLEQEKKELGIYVTDHPLLEVWDFFSNKTDLTIADLDTSYNGATIKLPGIISHVEKKTTRRGQKMYVLEFQDLAGAMEVVVFPNVASKLSDDFLASGDIGILEGQLSVDGDHEENLICKMFYSSFEKLNASTIRGSKPILLESKTKLTSGQLKKINDIISRVRGDSPVYFTYPEGRHKVTLRFKQSTSSEVENALQSIVAISVAGNGV